MMKYYWIAATGLFTLLYTNQLRQLSGFVLFLLGVAIMDALSFLLRAERYTKKG